MAGNIDDRKYTSLQIWCAAGVNLSGGRTKDGGDIVGASIFYHDVPIDSDRNIKSPTKKSKPHNELEVEEAEDPVAKLDEELAEGKRLVEEAERYTWNIYVDCFHHIITEYLNDDRSSTYPFDFKGRQSKRNHRMFGFAPQHMQYQKSPSSMRTPQQMSWKLFKCVLLTYYALLVCLEPKRVIIGKLLICW